MEQERGGETTAEITLVEEDNETLIDCTGVRDCPEQALRWLIFRYFIMMEEKWDVKKLEELYQWIRGKSDRPALRAVEKGQ